MKDCAKCNDWSMLIARVLISLIFIVLAYAKFTNMDGVVSYVASQSLPAPELLAWSGAIIEMVAGIAILLGVYTRWAAMVLAIYLVIVTIIFHRDIGDQNQLQQFLKNLAIIGGLFMLKLFGGGKLSLMKHCRCNGGKCECKNGKCHC